MNKTYPNERNRAMKEIISVKKSGCTQLAKIHQFYSDVELWSHAARYTYESDLRNHKGFAGNSKIQKMLDQTLRTVPSELGYPPASVK